MREKAMTVTPLAGPFDLRLADRHDEVRIVGHVEAVAIEQLVFQHDDRIGVADGRLEQPLGVGRRIGRHHLEARDNGRTTRRSIASAGRRPARPGPLGPRKTIEERQLAAAHVQGLGRPN